jgi:long-chain acyl-CoA synthetase
MAGVPKVFDTIKKTAEQKIESLSPFKKWMFCTAFEIKKKALEKEIDTPLWDFLVFRKVLQEVGGGMYAMLCGGAPLSKKTQEFMRIALNTVFIQGYGLTESCAISFVQGGLHGFFTERVGFEIFFFKFFFLNYFF